MGVDENRIEEMGNGSETCEYSYIFMVLTYAPHCMFKKKVNPKRKSKNVIQTETNGANHIIKLITQPQRENSIQVT